VADLRRGRLGAGDVPADGESFAELARIGDGTVVEEIHSSATPDTSSQVQDHDEWVVLLAGDAALDVDGSTLELRPGDWVLLPAGTSHRVLRTSTGAHWLAVHAPPRLT
jgi:cupin 2 domain-containing protein